MTRTRKLTLTMKEFSHLVSESLDVVPHAPHATQSFVHHPIIPVLSDDHTTHKSRPSSFHRMFALPPRSRSSAGRYEDAMMEKQVEDGSGETSRKMIVWPFSRSPRKNRAAATRDDEESQGVMGNTHHADFDAPENESPMFWSNSKGDDDNSLDSITSLAAASTSSLGSLLPADERLFFEVMSRDGFFSDETRDSSNQNRRPSASVRARASSPLTFAQPSESSPPRNDTRTRLQGMFENKSDVNVVAVTDVVDEPQRQTEVWCRRRLTQSSGTGTTTSSSYRDSLSVGDTDGSDDDPTPRASTFGSRTKLPPAVMGSEPRKCLKDVSSIVVPPSNTDAIVSESQSPTTTLETTPRTRTPSPTSSLVTSSVGVTFPYSPSPSPPRSQTPTAPSSSDITPPPKIVTVSPAGSPRLRPRSLSRTMTSPPCPRPPPTGPLPAVPSSIPPVPPLPPLLCKKSTIKMSPPLPISSPSRTPSSSSTVATPPSPPGGLRLPSRLSWVNTVRAVLPSPPASPIKASKGRSLPSLSPSREETRTSGGLKRPTSIGVIEAADNGHVRRTKSILLLASRSKSHASLGTSKRVQIHAEANTESSGPFRKPRRKSSTAAMYPLVPSFGAGANALASGGSELLVPLERRHSAPLLSTTSGSCSNAAQANADWTLSLPFCIDIPGNQIPVASLLGEGQGKLEEAPREDWTLCMPLKVGRVMPAIPASEGCGSECTAAETTETIQAQAQVQVKVHVQTQLPTPSPSPTLPSPTPPSPPPPSLCQLDEHETRPVSPAISLGPHAGGLDMDGGRGKRASGWHVYGWFDEVEVDEEVRVPLQLHVKRNQSNNGAAAASRRTTTHELSASQDSNFTVSTNGETVGVYHSARSSLLVN